MAENKIILMDSRRDHNYKVVELLRKSFPERYLDEKYGNLNLITDFYAITLDLEERLGIKMVGSELIKT